MLDSMKEKIAAVGCGLALALSAGCQAEDQPAAVSPGYFAPAVKAALKDARGQVIDFWKNKGVTLTPDQFVFLEGNQLAPNTCKERKSGSNPSKSPEPSIASTDHVQPSYCLRTKKIIMNPPSVLVGWAPEYGEQMPAQAAQTALARLILYHESGHAAQDRLKLFEVLNNGKDEDQANCYAGTLVALNAPGEVGMDRKFIAGLGSSLAPFNKGFADAQNLGRACDIPPP
jgi:hypothetical protein